MESHIGTDAFPSSRKPLEDKQPLHHTKNQPSLCKTQNISDILKNIEEKDSFSDSMIQESEETKTSA